MFNKEPLVELIVCFFSFSGQIEQMWQMWLALYGRQLMIGCSFVNIRPLLIPLKRIVMPDVSISLSLLIWFCILLAYTKFMMKNLKVHLKLSEVYKCRLPAYLAFPEQVASFAWGSCQVHAGYSFFFLKFVVQLGSKILCLTLHNLRHFVSVLPWILCSLLWQKSLDSKKCFYFSQSLIQSICKLQGQILIMNL